MRKNDDDDDIDFSQLLGNLDLSKLADLANLGDMDLFSLFGEGGISELLNEFGGMDGIHEAMQEVLNPESIAQVAKEMKENGGLHQVIQNPQFLALMKALNMEHHPELMKQALDHMSDPQKIDAMIKEVLGDGGFKSLFTADGPLGKILDKNHPIGGLLSGQGLGNLGQVAKTIQSLMEAFAPKKKPKLPADVDLHKFVSLVDKLGGVEKVADAMKDMGLGDMLEKAGGVAALKALMEERDKGEL